MAAPETATAPNAAAAREPRAASDAARANARVATTAALVAVIVIGAVLRVIVADQSVFADELSTYWISVTHGLGGVLALLYSSGRIQHAEITPPLSFLVSWLTTRAGHSPELLRLPALLAGTATIPLVYALGLRTVGRRAALVAASVTALSPFMIYYSAEARAYGLMMLLVCGAVISILLALDTGDDRWWALAALAMAAAFYTHYTCVFVLAVMVAWVLILEPGARRRMLLAVIGAGVLVIPWIPGLIADLQSPTVKILSALSPFTANAVRIDIQHWALGYPYTAAGGLVDLPGRPALVLLAGAVIVSVTGLARRALRDGWEGPVHAVAPARGRAPRLGGSARLVLVLALALATVVGEILGSALGNHIVGVRDLAASWPFLALSCGAATAAAGRRAGIAAAVLTVAGFALAAPKMLQARYARPDYRAAAAFVARQARAHDVVLDMTPTPGPLTALDVTLHRRLPVIRARQPAERDHPFGFADPIVPLGVGLSRAVTAADGARVFVVLPAFADIAFRVQLAPVTASFPAGYRLVTLRVWAGLEPTLVAVYADRPASPQ